MKTDDNQPPCPLCNKTETDLYFRDKNRTYLSCRHCSLVFVPEPYWLSGEEEKATYDLHENSPHDQGYRNFLSRLSIPLTKRLGASRKGLDFGCGPGPALSLMLEEAGHQIDLYDPIYFNAPELFNNQYDFISATEVVEHLKTPGKEFDRLFSLLKPGGLLGIMTKLVLNQAAFSKWHYTHDRTHISFYSRSTFEYIAERFNADLEFIGKDVILLRKKI